MLITKEQKGFTLVELAIVLTIVGLLIGGILKGQQLIQNARVTATVAQVNGFEAATTNFRDAYGELPGDLMDAKSRIQGCSALCDLSAGNTGNNKIGIKNWDFTTFQSTPLGWETATFSSIVPPSTPTLATNAETVLFWFELQNAGLISAVTQEGIDGSSITATFGGTIPSAKIGGGFWVGNSSGVGPVNATLGRLGTGYTILGSVLVMVAKPTTSPSNTSGTQVLTPAVAANIDRKIDDGLPDKGQVQAYGFDAPAATPNPLNSCYGVATPYAYQENVNSKDCGLILRLQR